MSLADGLPDVGAELVGYARAILERHLADELRRLRDDPMTYGPPPHEGQERLHISTRRHVLLVAANRFGKSTAGTRECLWRARGVHPYKRIRPHRFIVIGIPDFTFYRETSEPILRKWLPRSWLIDESKNEKWFRIRRIDGGTCTIQYKTFDQGRRSWQGFEADFIWLDEEHPEDIYREAFARVITSRGDFLQTFTPVGGLGWTYDRIYLPAVTGQRKDVEVIEGALAEYDESRPYGVGRILVPHLTYEDVLRFAREYPDEDERAIRIFGQYRARTGTVYKMFRREVHLVPRFSIPDHFEVWGGVDPGFHGFAALFFAQSPQARIYIPAEYFSEHETTRDRLRALYRIYRDRVRPVEPDAPDSATGFGEDEPAVVFFVDTEDPQVVLELNMVAHEERVPFVFASLDQGLKARKAGILRIQQLLQPDPDRATPVEVARPSTSDGEPVLYVFDDLESTWHVGDELITGQSRLVWEIERYRWKKPPKDKTVAPDDADDASAGGAHILSALRYGIMARYGAPEPPKERTRDHLPDHDREVWEHFEELEARMLEEAGEFYVPER